MVSVNNMPTAHLCEMLFFIGTFQMYEVWCCGTRNIYI